MAHQITDYASNQEDEAVVYAMQLSVSTALPMALNAAVELSLLDIIAKGGPDAQLSSSDIASFLLCSSTVQLSSDSSPDSDNAAVSSSMIDRILNLLSTFSIVTCSSRQVDNGKVERVYGLTPAGICFLESDNALGSLAPMLQLNCSPAIMEGWYHLKESVLEGSVPFVKAHEQPIFHYMSVNPKLRSIFNRAMSGMTGLSMNKLVEVYQGFQGINILVDVAGSTGTLLTLIITKYPNIKGINFDLPQVIENAPPFLGIEHIGGDMFQRVPKGDGIILRGVIHDWNDEKCICILKNCYDALADHGKVIIVDSILPLIGETSEAAKYSAQLDLLMLTNHGRGKERTREEFRAIASAAGFRSFQIVACVNANSVIELKK